MHTQTIYTVRRRCGLCYGAGDVVLDLLGDRRQPCPCIEAGPYVIEQSPEVREVLAELDDEQSPLDELLLDACTELEAVRLPTLARAVELARLMMPPATAAQRFNLELLDNVLEAATSDMPSRLRRARAEASIHAAE